MSDKPSSSSTANAPQADRPLQDGRSSPVAQPARAKRRSTPLRGWLYRTVAPLALGLLRLFWRTCREVRIIGEDNLDPWLGQPQPLIFCFWHQHLLFGLYYMMRLQARGQRIGFLISPSRDGELAAHAAQLVGVEVIRGSSTRTGAQALRELYLAVVRQRLSLATTPDGPRGPPQKLKPGVLMLAQLTGAPIIPLSYAAQRAWRLKTWDCFVLPAPLTRIVITIGKPHLVERHLPATHLEQRRLMLEATLHDLSQAAKASLCA